MGMPLKLSNKIACRLLLCLLMFSFTVQAAAEQSPAIDPLNTISGSQTTSETEVDYTDWYQVEVIIFAHKNPLSSNEMAPFKQRYYPAVMYAVAAEAEWVPENAQQQNQIEAYLDLFSADSPAQAADSAPGFLFESRSQFLDRPVIDAVIPLAEEVTDVTATIDTQALLAQLNDNSHQAYVALEPSQRSLNMIVRSLNRSKGYALISHQAWRQPFVGETQAAPILIQAGKHLGDYFEVDGTLTFYLSRFLHVKADLWYTPNLEQDITLTNGTGPLTNDINKEYQADVMAASSYQLEHSRRMRSATLHYIDHPLFGILIKIDDYTGPPA
ncbi:peptidoglycan binding protein CsiV [Pseudomonadales bacterium]|nr:peptidoglycan binding protein CsiV [Pseudomonadales bacterium]